MQTLEIETRIDQNGHIHLPTEFQQAYGKLARLLVPLPEAGEPILKRRQPGSAKGILTIIDDDSSDELLEKTRGIWTQEDGLEYQMKIRNEWELDGQLSE